MKTKITEKDIVTLKAKSLEEGILFEMFITNILHKYVNENLLKIRTRKIFQ